MVQKKNKKKKPQKPGVIAGQRRQGELVRDGFNPAAPYYRKNMEALRARYPELAEKVTRCPFSGRYRIEPSGRRDGAPNLYCTEGDFYYYDNSDPIADARQQLEQLKLSNAKLALCLGVGLGYELTHFVANLAASVNTIAILVIERDLELFKLACHYSDMSKLITSPSLFFLVGAEPELLYVPLKNTIKSNQWYLLGRALKPFYHLSSLRLAKDYYLGAIRTVNEASAHSVLDFGNCPDDSLIGIENMLLNLATIIRNPGVDRLYGAFKGKPAIIASTGPSLNKNKHLLKGLEDKALLLCPDASLPILLDMGVRPHLVTSLERVLQVTHFFKNLTEDQLSETYLAACPVIRKEAYDLYHGPKLIVYRNLDHFKWLEVERGILDIKASAGNMAFKIAAAIGCDPIILIGQDLSFTRDGLTHAAGSRFGEKQAWLLNDLITVPGNDGLPVQTNEIFFNFLKGYEVDIAEYRGACVNATEGGAFIQGTQVMTFAEAIERYMGEDYFPLQLLQSRLTPPDEATALTTARQVMGNIDRTAGELAKISQVCRDGLAYLAEAAPGLTGVSQAQAQAVLSKVIDFRKRCAADHHTWQLFFTHVIQSFTINFEITQHAIPDAYTQPAEAVAHAALRHEEWFATINSLANVCRDTLLRHRQLLGFDFNL